ncbi:MAG: extracellular solute-binding protein [Oscillospiraceae bacterium]|jgi:ABC-type glycerol-3-phosphate transport system substrate-binding protein|nr:extracellular solute-binding protein [Oscillospiraceae bacterium]
MKKLRPITAIALALTIALTLFACGTTTKNDGTGTGTVPGASTNPSSAPGEIIKLENAYTETKIPVEIEQAYGSGFEVVGDKIVFMDYITVKVSEVDENGDKRPDVSYAVLKSAKLDGSEMLEIWKPEVIGNGEPDEDGFVTNYGLNAFAPGTDGTIWLVLTEARWNNDQVNPIYESKSSLAHLSATGELLSTLDLKTVNDGQDFYSQQMSTDKDGNVYITGSNGSVFVFDGATGELAFTLKDQLDYIYGMVETNKGNVVYLSRGTDAYEFRTIDYAAKKSSPPVKYTGTAYFNSIVRGTGEYSFYYVLGASLWAMNLDTMTETKIINFQNSDIDSSLVQGMAAMDDGSFVAFYMDWSSGGQPTSMGYYHLVENKNATLEGKTLITLGSTYAGGDLSSAVMKYNKSHPNVRITIKDYSDDNHIDYTTAIANFDLDIVQGRAPDIINLQQLNTVKYSSKGVLADLNPLLDADPTLDRANMFENILEACSLDGKLYHIIPQFGIVSLAGKASIFGPDPSITPAELNAILEKYPDAQLLQSFSAETWIYLSILYNLDEYIDWATSTCNFDTPEFASTLNLARRFKTEKELQLQYEQQYADGYYRQDEDADYQNDKSLLSYGGVEEVQAVRGMKEMFGEDVTYVGFPSGGEGGSMISAATDFAIAATSQNKEAAWDFISSMLQTGTAVRYGLTLDKRVVESSIAKEMIPLRERNFEEGVQLRDYLSGGWSGTTVYSLEELEQTVKNGFDIDIDNYAVTQAEADQFLGIITSAKRMLSTGSNEQIQNIINEETGPFIAGQKTAEETARIIQSRVGLYVSENS